MHGTGWKTSLGEDEKAVVPTEEKRPIIHTRVIDIKRQGATELAGSVRG